MAGYTSEWILKLSDMITAPMRKISKSIGTASGQFSNYDDSVKDSTKDIKRATDAVDDFTEQNGGLGGAATRWNQLSDIIGKFGQSLSFTEEYQNLEGDIQLMTDKSGAALRKATHNVYKLSEVYKESGDNIANTANAVAKQFGISFDEALDKVSEGFHKGANLSGEFLTSFKQYARPLHDMGYSIDQAIAKMVQLNKAGINLSDANRAMGKMNSTLQEMSDSTRKALADIGILPEELQGKTVKEMMSVISEAMDNAENTAQDKQQVLTALFGQIGDRMGSALNDTLLASSEKLEDLPQVDMAGAKIKGFMAEAKAWLSDAVGNVGVWAGSIAPVVTGIGSGIVVVQEAIRFTKKFELASKAMNGVKKVGTAIQWAFNAAMSANPVFLIIAGIVALGVAIGVMVSKISGWGKAWKHVVNGAKYIWKAYVGSAKLEFLTLINGIMMGIDKIKVGWYKFKLAMGIGDKKENQSLLDAANSDVDRRKKIITDQAKKVAEYAKQAGYEFSAAFGSLHRKKDKDKQEAGDSEQDAGTTGSNDYDKDSGNSEKRNKNEVKGSNDYDKDSGNSEKRNKNEVKNKNKNNTITGNGLNLSGGGIGMGKNVTLTLNITNNFSGKINSKLDVRELASEVAGVMTDRARDMLLTT